MIHQPLYAITNKRGPMAKSLSLNWISKLFTLISILVSSAVMLQMSGCIKLKKTDM